MREEYYVGIERMRKWVNRLPWSIICIKIFVFVGSHMYAYVYGYNNVLYKHAVVYTVVKYEFIGYERGVDGGGQGEVSARG